jgi:hypothetical protein
MIDATFSDQDGDGYIDTGAYDPNFDGNVDEYVTTGRCIRDVDFDGTPDEVIYEESPYEDPPGTYRGPGEPRTQQDEPETQQHEPEMQQDPEMQHAPEAAQDE